MKKTTNLPKFNSQDGRYYLMTPDMSEKLSPFFDPMYSGCRLTAKPSVWILSILR